MSFPFLADGDPRIAPARVTSRAARRAAGPRYKLRPGIETHELVIDLFAGGGGASCGIEAALGRPVDIAVNHDPIAMKVHKVNHPDTTHLIANVWEVDPVEACAGRPVGLLWASPDCTHHSRAKGAKPLSSKRRALASVVVRWARAVRPRFIFMENVGEFADWGPLDNDGYPIKAKKGRSFRCWLGKIKAQGYRIEFKMLVAADYGTPTTRKRLFIIASLGGPIVWPEPSHGEGRANPWRSAAECLDLNDAGASIFGRKKPLAPATMRRIAAGIDRYVVNAQPFMFPLTHQGDDRVHSVEDPMRTVTGAHRGELAICTPVLVNTAHGEVNAKNNRRRWGRGHRSVAEPLGTVCAGGTDAALCTPILVKVGEPAPAEPCIGMDEPMLCQPMILPVKSWGGGGNDARPATAAPMRTVTTSKRGEFAVATPVIVKYHGGASAHQSERAARCDEPLRTVDTQPRFALCTPVLIQTGYGERQGQRPRCLDVHEPLGTVVSCGAKHAIAVPVIVPHFGGANGHPCSPRAASGPVGAVTTKDHTSVATAFLLKWFGTSKDGQPITMPMPTVLSGGGKGGGHAGLVHAFLVKYYGGKKGKAQTSSIKKPMPTVVTKERFGLVTIGGQDYQIVDIFLRMLKPSELKLAQGFAETYDLSGAGTKTKEIALIGNSVCQQIVEAIIRANVFAPVGQTEMVFAAAG